MKDVKFWQWARRGGALFIGALGLALGVELFFAPFGFLERRILFSLMVAGVAGAVGFWSGRRRAGAPARPSRLAINEALRRERSFLRRVIDTAPSLIFVKDWEGRFVLGNSALARGYGSTPEAIVGKRDEDFNDNPEELEHFHRDDREVIRSRREKLIPEERVTQADGQVRWFSTVKVPLVNEDGSCDKMLGVATDITARKAAEDALRLSEERFRLVGRATNDVIWDAEPLLRRMSFNEAIEPMLGFAPQEIPPTIDWWVERIHPDDRERVLRSVHEALANLQQNSWTAEYRMLRRDGSPLTVLDRGYILRDGRGRPVRLIGSMQNVTERKRTEEALRRWNERLALLSETAGYLLQERDPVKMVWQVFEKVARRLDLDMYLSYAVEDGRLRLESWAGVPDETAAAHRMLELNECFCGDVVSRRQMVYIPFMHRCANPKARILQGLDVRAYICHPLLAGDRLLGTMAFCSRSRETYSEEDLEFLGALCNHLAIARERVRLEGELSHKVELLAEADKRKDEFLAMLAHELRNPLAPIRNAVQILRLAGAQSGVLDRQREIIDRQVTHMAHLLDDLLDVSRITQGKIELQQRPVALGDVFERAVEIVMPLIEVRHHTLRRTPLAPDLRVQGDPDRLAQIVGNLLTNAAKYTAEGGEIALAGEREGEEAVIRVRDTGMGIAPEMLSQIFDLFVQVSPTIDRTQGGLGIGLTLVRNLVQMHGGRIEAHSGGLGQGSEFTVRLPLLAPARTERGEAAADGPVKLNPR